MSKTKFPDPAALHELAKRVYEGLGCEAQEAPTRREARRAELAETRAYLESVVAEEPAHEVFLAYLLRLVWELEIPDDFAESPGGEAYRRALRALVPLAGRDGRQIVRFVARARAGLVRRLCPEESEILANARLHRRLIATGRPPNGEIDEMGEMMIRLYEALEIYVLIRNSEGRDGCVATLQAIADYVEAEASHREQEVFADEQPCYARDPATAPEAFLVQAPAAVQLADAAAARAFLEGVEPEHVHQGAFRVACLALLERLEHDLELGEVDPDWEDFLWRLLRAFLPLVDPAWVAAHRVLPAEFLDAERRQVESFGDQIAAARPGQVGGAPADAVGWLFGVQMSALKIYILGRCTLGQEEVEALTEAYHRYANRDRAQA